MLPGFCYVLSFKDLQEMVFHKLMKLIMQTKAGWETQTTHFNILAPHLLPLKI